MGLTALRMGDSAARLGLEIVVDAAFALASVSGCFCAIAACLRFGQQRLPILESWARNALGIYLLHYVFVVWLQYALLDVGLFAAAKGVFVFSGSLLLAWASTATMRLAPFGSA